MLLFPAKLAQLTFYGKEAGSYELEKRPLSQYFILIFLVDNQQREVTPNWRQLRRE